MMVIKEGGWIDLIQKRWIQWNRIFKKLKRNVDMENTLIVFDRIILIDKSCIINIKLSFQKDRKG